VGPYKAKNALHILKHNQLQSSKGAREEWLQFCWDFVKSPWNDEIALQHFFSCLQQCKSFFLFHLCCMQFFSSDKGLREIFFEIIPPPPPPQELNGRPLRTIECGPKSKKKKNKKKIPKDMYKREV